MYETILTWEIDDVIVTFVVSHSAQGDHEQWQMGVAGLDAAHVIDATSAAAIIGGRTPTTVETL